MRPKRARRPRFFAVTVPRRFARNGDRVIGFAVAHADGEGVNIFLDAFPLHDRLTLRDPLASIEYGAGDGSDLLPVNWPPDTIGTAVEVLQQSRTLTKTIRK